MTIRIEILKSVCMIDGIGNSSVPFNISNSWLIWNKEQWLETILGVWISIKSNGIRCFFVLILIKPRKKFLNQHIKNELRKFLLDAHDQNYMSSYQLNHQYYLNLVVLLSSTTDWWASMFINLLIIALEILCIWKLNATW